LLSQIDTKQSISGLSKNKC